MPAKLHLRLYVAGDTLRSRLTVSNVKEACATFTENKCRVDVIDVKKDPTIAIRDQIIAIPTIMVISPYSPQQFIGNMNTANEVMRLLKLR